MNNLTRLISDAAVQQTLSIPDLIPVMAQVFQDLSAGALKMLPRNALFHQNGNIFAVMSATIPRLGVCGCKAAIFPGPVAAAAGSQQSVVLLFDLETGALQGIVSAEYITAARTAASTAVATDALAVPDASVLCLLGAGRQALSHARAICAVRPIREIRIWNPRPARARSTCAELETEGLAAAIPVESAKEAVRGAQIVCTVSKASEPILWGDWLQPGTHVNAVGACGPFARELDLSVLRCARVYVDQMEAALSGAGDLLIPIQAGLFAREEIAGEIGDVLRGTCPGRPETDRETITIFESCGLAAQDVAAACAAIQKAAGREGFLF